MGNIRILNGTYKIRGNDVDLVGMVFPLVEEFKVGARGGYVTVDGAAVAGFPDRNIKIMCDGEHAYENAGKAKTTKREETDEETIDRMRERFDMLEDMTKACKKGDVRAMIVSGPPGVGKSFGVEKVLGKHDLISEIGGTPSKYQVVKGAMSAIGLYCKLFNYADKDVKSVKMREHLKALESRCHYIDLTIDTDREKMLRIKQIVKDGMLTEYNLAEDVVQDIVEFCEGNKNRLRELSLRTVLKVADLAKAFPTKWEAMAENTVMKR